MNQEPPFNSDSSDSSDRGPGHSSSEVAIPIFAGIEGDEDEGTTEPSGQSQTQDSVDLQDRHEARIRENREDLGIMIAKNREERASGGRERYLGFRLFRREHAPRDANEDPYQDAVLPIRVAMKYPELLGFLTLEYQTVYHHEKLRSRTKVIVRPGKITTLRARARKSLWLLIGALLLALACVVLAISTR